MGSSVTDCSLITLPRITDAGGSLGFVEAGRHVPFGVARFFYIQHIPRDAVRGGHAHRECAQFLIALEGRFKVTLHDGTEERNVDLDRPDRGLHIPAGIWVTLHSLTEHSVIIALASAPEVEADYLRSFDGFLAWKRDRDFPIILEASGITLRPYRPADTLAFCDSARASAPEVGRWLSWCTPDYDLARAEAYILSSQVDLASRKVFGFGIFRSGPGGNHLGGVALNRIDWAARSANLGYWVATHASRQGIGSRAAWLACRFGFGQLGLERIEILADPGNAPSRAIALRLGARLEGVLRRKVRRGGEPADLELYSLLPEELGPEPGGPRA
jgi:RimJ/RimL family protein N-acetyltransferase